MAPRERDISTDRIAKVIGEIEARQKPPSGEHLALPCAEHSMRITQLETNHAELKAVCKEHDQRLHSGDMGFLEIRNDIQSLTKAVNGAVEQMKAYAGVNWGHEILKSLISWGVPVTIIVLVWALVGSGAVNLVKAHP